MKRFGQKILSYALITIIVSMSLTSYVSLKAENQKEEPTTWIVDITGQEGFIRIQSAITVAETGDIIIILPGTYQEKITIDKSLNIIGAHKTQVKIKPTDTYAPFVIQADNVSIMNLTIQDSSINGILIETVEGFTLKNCILKNHHNCGIRLEQSTDCHIEASSFDDNNNAGVLAKNSENITIKNCTFTDNHFYGIWLLGSKENFVNNNDIEYSGKSAIRLESTSHNNISFNNLKETDLIGINSDQAHFNEIYGNVILKSHENGLTMKNSSNNIISGNTIVLNKIGIKFTSCCIYNNHIYHNNFIDNAEYQAYDSSGNSTWDGGANQGGNYWNDYNGTDTNGDGFGDRPYVVPGSANSTDFYPLMEPWIVSNPEDNTAPLPPTIQGDTSQQNGTLMNYTITAIDPDDHDIQFFVDWGDGIDTGWLGPYSSGHSLELTHSWSLAGNYSISARVIDEYGKYSDWSLPFNVTILPPPEYPELIFLDVKGGWASLNITIYNRGRVDAQHVEYSVSTDHPYVLIGKQHSGVINAIPSEEGVDVLLKPIIGFGNAVFTLEAEATNNAYVSAEESVYLFFVYLQILAK